MINLTEKYQVLSGIVIPTTITLGGTPTHADIFGYGGLKCYSQSTFKIESGYISNNIQTKSSLRSQYGQIVYLRSTGQYYQCYNTSGPVEGNPQYALLPALTTGSPTFPGLTSSAGILITNGANISFSDGGNVATTGTASFGATTVSGLKSNGIISGSSTLDIVGAGTFGGLVSAVTGFTSSTGYIQIGGGATSSTGFYSPGTSNLTTLNVSTISSSGLATLADLYVPGNTQLGNEATDTTSVWGTLNIVNDSSYSGSIYADSSGNLILDGSGAGGVEITDGLMYLGSIPIQSGSYSGPSYTGGMISSSAKIVAVNGFANAGSDIASFEVDASGNLQCASLKETSLRQYKHEIHYITESQLLNISKLKPITFLYNQDVPQDVNDTRIRQAGFIAQQVEQIYPQVAWYKQGKLAGLQYQRLTAYLTRGIQELAQENDKLNIRVTQLENTVAQLLKGMNT